MSISPTDPDYILQFTQEQRLRMIHDIDERVSASDGKFSDKDDVLLYNTILNSLSNTAVGQKKAATEERKIDVALQTSANVAKLMEDLANGSGVLASIYKPVEGGATSVDTPSVDLPSRDLVPGQMDTVVPELDINDFVPTTS